VIQYLRNDIIGIDQIPGWAEGIATEMCYWTGVMCNVVDGVQHVSQIYLPGYNLSGTIPAEIGNLVGLAVLSFTDNVISGPLPPEIGNLTGLVSLELNLNNISGTIPAEIGNCTELLNLYLSSNVLSGTIPAELAKLKALQVLYLSENQLVGVVPDLDGLPLLICDTQSNNLTCSESLKCQSGYPFCG